MPGSGTLSAVHDLSTDGIRCMLMRGGSSKGAYFLADDLPADPTERDAVLLAVMGSPDPRQIDGVGGAHPLTSKVAVVSASDRPDVDVEYLFLQVGVDRPTVSDSQNCGNLLAGVGPFALERGLLDIKSNPESDPDSGADTDSDSAEHTVRILMRNTDSVAVARFPVAGGRPVYHGDTTISGVPGAAAPIVLDFDGIAGGSTGALLPTGSNVDEIEGVACTLVDNGMPVVVMRADALGVTGYESCPELEADQRLRSRLEAIRLAAGERMGLGDVTDTTVPKLALVAPPVDGGHLCTRMFIPHRCHDAIGVLAAVSVATAGLLPGTPAAEVMAVGHHGRVVLEHPTGSFEAAVELADHDGAPVVERAGIVRTARKLMDGVVFPRPAPGDR